MENNKKIILLIGSISILIIFSTLITIFFQNTKINTEKNNNLIYINDIQQEIIYDSDDDIVLEDENNILGTLEIPKLDINAPIKEGTSQEILAEYIGHFANSDIWEGNVVLASHNRGNSVVHYFEKINELEKGDTIIYKTKLGIRNYEVSEIKEIASTDWSIIEKNEKLDNKITLVTCITNQPDKRLCVIGEEKNT